VGVGGIVQILYGYRKGKAENGSSVDKTRGDIFVEKGGKGDGGGPAQAAYKLANAAHKILHPWFSVLV
jgi:hypothetical protein